MQRFIDNILFLKDQFLKDFHNKTNKHNLIHGQTIATIMRIVFTSKYIFMMIICMISGPKSQVL